MRWTGVTRGDRNSLIEVALFANEARTLSSGAHSGLPTTRSACCRYRFRRMPRMRFKQMLDDP